MPIHPDYRTCTHPHWRDLANQIKFSGPAALRRVRARTRATVLVIADGGWLGTRKPAESTTSGVARWAGAGRRLAGGTPGETILTCAHLTRTPPKRPTNLAALCRAATCGTTGASTSRARTGTGASRGPSKTCSTDRVAGDRG